MPDGERSAIEAIGQRHFKNRSIWIRLPHVAVRRQAVALKWGADKGGPVVDLLEIDERADARVYAITACDQRCDRVGANAVSSRPKCTRSPAECLFQCICQCFDLGELQIGGQVLDHGVARHELLSERRRIPRVQVRTNLSTALVSDVAHYCRCVRIDRDVICREVRGPHTQAVEEPCQPPQFTNVPHRHAFAAAVPIVLFGIEGHDKQERGALRNHAGPPRNAATRSSKRRARPPHPERNTTISQVMRCDGLNAFLYSSSPRRKLKTR